MKNNRGFTLVEVLAVLVILVLIMTIITPKVFKQFEHAEKVTDQEQINALINTSKIYMNQNSNLLPAENDIYIISLDDLKESGLIKSSQILNPSTKEELKGCILVKYENNKYKYEYKEENGWCNRTQMVTSGDGLYKSETEPGRFIYRGRTPNNWIELNEGSSTSPNYVKYRIISYESDGTIKVIRDASIESKSFDERDSNDTTTGPRHNTDNTFCNYSGTYYGCNVWGNLSNTFYNGATLGSTFNYKYYANNTNTELTNSTNTGTVTVDSTLNQYLNNTWITDKEMSKYIDNHDFNVGGVYYTTSYTGGDKGIVREKEEENLYTWTGKVGLLNITDYAESSTNSLCTDVWSNYYYNPNNETYRTSNEWPCKYDNYNYKSGYTQWFLSPYSNNRNSVWNVSSTGYFGNYYADSAYGVRPAFYLKSGISLSGSGTSSDPYRIDL